MEIKFKNKQGNDIVESNWESSWSPKAKQQWKDGHSSKEFAKFALSDSFLILISQVLKSCDIDEQDFECVPEAATSLGEGFCRGGCRNHDLLMKGSKDCIIGVEAKVSEPFQRDWEKELAKQKEKNKEKDTRAYKLREYLAIKEKNVDKIGYQLFTSTRGTINNAIVNKKKKCIILIIVFDGEIDDKDNKYEEKVKKNNEDFNSFCESIGVENNKPIYRDEIECWIKKVTVHVSQNYSFESVK